MKSLVLTGFLFSLFLSYSLAQDKELYASINAITTKKAGTSLIHHNYYHEPLDSILRFRNNIAPIDIPNAHEQFHVPFLMPIKILTGKALSPMPGTEKLNMLDAKTADEVQRNKIIKIKTFPINREDKRKELSMSNKQIDKKKKAST